MQKNITLSYPDDNSQQFSISYSIVTSHDAQEISCSIDSPGIPVWLQLRKFSFESRMQNGNMVLMFNETNNSRNLATTLFIDTVYSRIIETERKKSGMLSSRVR